MISISSVILGVLVFFLLTAAAVYFLGLRPARMVERWVAGLNNGGHFPKRPVINGLYWLLPVHRELQAVADKIEGLKQQLEAARSGSSEEEFLHHCVLASLLEGVLVVDAQGMVTLANVEFIHMFQLNQSPLRRPMGEVIRDRKLQAMILEALTTSRVQSGRFTRPAATVEVGRPQSIEVSAVPLRLQKDKVEGVIVLFLPPPDRLRIVQDMKRHAQRLNNLVNELAFSRSEDAAPAMRQPVDLKELLEEVAAGFTAKAENGAIKIDMQVEPGLPGLRADGEQVQLAVMHMLDNLTFDLEAVSSILLEAGNSSKGPVLAVTFTGGSISESQLRRALALPLDMNAPCLPVVGGASLGLVRAVMQRHGGSVEAALTDEKQLCVSLAFPADALLMPGRELKPESESL